MIYRDTHIQMELNLVHEWKTAKFKKQYNAISYILLDPIRIQTISSYIFCLSNASPSTSLPLITQTFRMSPIPFFNRHFEFQSDWMTLTNALTQINKHVVDDKVYHRFELKQFLFCAFSLFSYFWLLLFICVASVKCVASYSTIYFHLE